MARERSSWEWQAARPRPLALNVASALRHEVTLIEQSLESRFVKQKPERSIGDRAYGSNPLATELGCQGIEVIGPHRRKRKKPYTQDRRKPKRYKGRWKVELLFAKLNNFRRLVVHYERKSDNFLGFARLGRIVILLRHLQNKL